MLDISKLSVDELTALITQAQSLKKQKVDGVPTDNASVTKLAGEVVALAAKLQVKPEKVVRAMGMSFTPQIEFRAYPPKDPNKPRAKRGSKK